jgi:hypothetical protein
MKKRLSLRVLKVGTTKVCALCGFWDAESDDPDGLCVDCRGIANRRAERGDPIVRYKPLVVDVPDTDTAPD